MSERVLHETRDFPIFQNRMYDSRADALACPRGDIRLIEDLDSGLVRNAAFAADLMVYDAAYQNEQGISTAFAAHLEHVGDLVLDLMGTSSLIEVGCGKGGFLELLRARGAHVTGFDPTYEGDNPDIQVCYFGPDVGLRADGLILRHVLEHVEDPVGFLMQLAEANGGQGRIYIEVPCFDWICESRAWFDIFYEHVNYFRMSDFHRIFGHVVHAERSFGGQYLSVIADLSTLRRPVRDPLDAVSFPDDFAVALHGEGLRADDIVWGGASKGLIYALLRERAGHPVAAIIDINPAKQGKYLGVLGRMIQSPEAALAQAGAQARIVVMNPNYMNEIREMTRNAYIYQEVGA